MAKLLFNLHTAGSEPTADEVKRAFGLTDMELDAGFGVIEVDSGVYTILVADEAASKVQSTGSWRVEGPFGDAPQAPFDAPGAAQ